jgi:circadian clock protein KaiB
MPKKDAVRVVTEGTIALQLFVSGMSPKSMEAIENIKRLCKEHPHEAFDLEIIDLYKHPELAIEKSIVFSPSLIRQFPLPKKIIIGTLADKAKVIKALGLTFKK